MDDRPGSPEIDVVSDGDRSGAFRFQGERTSSGRNATNLRAANQNGANRAAANTNKKDIKGETVNLRVRNMGKIIVKKEPESDEDSEVSYSLSSLLEECDFEKAPAKKSRALKSPTSLAMARSKSMETTRTVTGRPRSLENVISSLKSARATDARQNPVVPISMPSQIASTAPNSQITLSSPSSGALGSGPQIVDVRSLATGAQTMASGTSTRIIRSTAKPASSSSPKPLNIRFVLPATEPFNSSEFQQVLQTALASVISQSKGIEATVLQQAIQAALTTVTKLSMPLSANQLQEAIQSSLAALSGRAPISPVTPVSLTQAPAVLVPQITLKQPQAIVPRPSNAASQPVASISTVQTSSQLSTTSSAATQIVTQGNSTVVNGSTQLTSGITTSSAASLNQSPLNVARDALIKALQEKRVLNTPISLSTSALSSTSEVSPSLPVEDSFDMPCPDSPPSSSPVLPTSETPASNSTGVDKSPVPTSAAIPNITCAAAPLTQTATFISSKSNSKPYIKPNQSPMNSGTQTALKSVPLQLSTSQGPSSVVSPAMLTLTPGTASVNFIPQTNSTVQSAKAPIPISKIPQAIAPTQLVQFSLYPTSPQNAPVVKPVKKVQVKIAQTQTTPSVGCGGGCCQYCRSCHENNNRCGLPSCGKSYPNRSGLRKHYYFNPTHKPQIPLEKAAAACDSFLPLELNDNHRRARLRELFKRLPDDELQELIKPRLAKVMSLYQLLEQKSLRVSVGNVSAFKMFTEFERFRKEVEAKLMELILLPQGKSQSKVSTDAGKVSSNNDNKPANVKSSEATEQATKESSKDSTPAAAPKTDNKVESSVTQSKTDTSSAVGSSETAKKTVESICVDSDVEMSSAKATDVKSSSSDQASSNQAGDSPSGEGKKTESDKDSSDSVPSTKPSSATIPSGESLPSKDGEKKEGELPKQSSSLPQTVDGNENAASLCKSSADQPPETEQPKQDELPGCIPGESTPKDSTSVPMEVDEQVTKHSSEADSKPSETPSSDDVIMVDSQKEVESGSKDGEEKTSEEEKAKGSQDGLVKENKPVVCTGEERESAASGKENTSMDGQEQNEKPPASSESKTTENELAGRDSKEEKMAKKPASEGNEISAMVVEEQGNNSKNNSDESQVKDATEEKTVEAEAKAEEPKADGKDADSDPLKEAVKNKAEEAQNGEKVENTDVDSGSDTVTAGSSKQASEVAMETDKAEVVRSKVGDQGSEDASKKKTSHSVESEGDQLKEIPKTTEANTESDKPKEPTTAIAKGEENAKVSSSEEASSSGDAAGSTDTTPAASSNSTAQAGSDSVVVKRRRITLEDLDLGDDDDDDEIDENNLLDFTLPFAVKWGRIVKNVRALEAKKIARKENYSDQDMKHFIYNKPKDAANAVIIADCHAHPSFFRAYVMPALLDVHIDDFGLFGKKLLSRLYLPKEKYVRVLRDGIGPELAKILGINIFPTFKRIQDTWQSIKMPLGNAFNSSQSRKTVLTVDLADDFDVPDEESETAPADKTGGTSQNTASRAADSLKRPGPTDNVPSDNSKRQRLDNSDAQKNTNQTKEGGKEPTKSSEQSAQKDATQQSEPNKGQKSNEADSSKNATQADGNNKSQSGKSNSTQLSDKTAIPVIDLESKENKAGFSSSTSVAGKESTPQPAVINLDGPNTDAAEPMSVDREQDPKSSNNQTPKVPSVGVEKSTFSSSSSETTPKASSLADRPSTSTGDASAKTCASSIIPATATIYTSGVGKKGASQVPLPATSKGSPLFLIPVEKISPKLIEQFIQQAKGDGVKTRSSDKKKAKKPKQNSQVLVLIPSPNPNGSPTIQALTSAEQLESNGDKKPLLLLPSDKVPKSIATQSQTVRRKMVITMVAPSSGAASGTKSTTSSVPSTSSATSAATTGGQSAEATAPVQSVKGPIMSAKEGGNTTTTSKEGDSDSTKSADGAMSLSSVVTSPLNSPYKELSGSASTTQSGSDIGPTGADKDSSQSVKSSNESGSQDDKSVGDSPKDSSTTNKESSSTKESTASEALTTATPSGATGTELDMLGSSLMPSDFTLDSLLKDIEEDGSGGEGNEMPPLDVSEIMRSFEDMPAGSGSSTPANSSIVDSEGDTGTAGDSSESANELQVPSSIQGKSSIQEEHDYANTRRQSPRRVASSKSASGSSTVDTSDPNTSGGSKGDSDIEEGSPPRKLRKVPTRTSARSSPQVTFVSDKEVSSKGSQGSPAKAKGRK